LNYLFILLFTTVMLGQDVQYNYDRDANFFAYQTYQWVENDRKVDDQLLHQDIRRAIGSQLAQKGLRRVAQNADLYIRYGTAVNKERQLDAWTMGPRWNGMVRGNTSTVEVGMLVLHIYDPAKKKLVWRGSVSKTLDVNKDLDRNYKNLEKAVSKLLRNYPPKSKS
jgi:Domain of unknown function (DUF4136)